MKKTSPTRVELETYFIDKLVKVTLYDDDVLFGTLIEWNFKRKWYQLNPQKGLDYQLTFRVSHIKKIEVITLDEYKKVKGNEIKEALEELDPSIKNKLLDLIYRSVKITFYDFCIYCGVLLPYQNSLDEKPEKDLLMLARYTEKGFLAKQFIFSVDQVIKVEEYSNLKEKEVESI